MEQLESVNGRIEIESPGRIVGSILRPVALINTGRLECRKRRIISSKAYAAAVIYIGGGGSSGSTLVCSSTSSSFLSTSLGARYGVFSFSLLSVDSIVTPLRLAKIIVKKSKNQAPMCNNPVHKPGADSSSFGFAVNRFTRNSLKKASMVRTSIPTMLIS